MVARENAQGSIEDPLYISILSGETPAYSLSPSSPSINAASGRTFLRRKIARRPSSSCGSGSCSARTSGSTYIHTEPPRDAGYGASPGARNDAPRIVYLSTETLVIVPDDLQLQWVNEAFKHTTDLLRVLRVPRRDELLDAPVLATDYNVPEQEGRGRFSVKNAISMSAAAGDPRWCSRRENVLPLLEILWKRLVVDEGHNAAKKRTNYAMLTWLLRLQYRAAQGRDRHSDYERERDIQFRQQKQRRRWHNRERLDFHKLGTMFGEALIMMPFASDPKASSTLIVNPLSWFSSDGPWPGHTAVLTHVMASVVVRHRYEDVEQELRLLFLQPHTVLLDMDMYAVKTYNLIQATIAISAVDSERKY
ncbi:hypothetical protein C8Q80DRAFT_1274868 [Daedaleopsis nitida]|nr:hypothetical protein C8Q80DRAFT_1274868 [Daedaleopsis nitida]